MPSRHTFDRLPPADLLLHWLIALATLFMLAYGLIIETLPDDGLTFELVHWHRQIGIAILFLLLVRFLLRCYRPFPPSLSPLSRPEALARKLVHRGQLLLILVMILSGLAYASGVGYSTDIAGLFTVPAYVDGKRHLANWGSAVHELASNMLLVLILLHSLAAIKHQWIRKDGTLSRMMGLGRRR
ncbi:cytochrome b [Coralliovum pocilloporae]|uniref:cytochrome b n=1 Tax=Coralliovum pocilloporae TaxID=3066369 RepID=UPI00330754F7